MIQRFADVRHQQSASKAFIEQVVARRSKEDFVVMSAEVWEREQE